MARSKGDSNREAKRDTRNVYTCDSMPFAAHYQTSPHTISENKKKRLNASYAFLFRLVADMELRSFSFIISRHKVRGKRRRRKKARLWRHRHRAQHEWNVYFPLLCSIHDSYETLRSKATERYFKVQCKMRPYN